MLVGMILNIGLEPYFENERVTLYQGDCIEVLRSIPTASIDSVVTDPPYGLEFMGKAWDKFGGGQMGKPGIGDRQTDWVSNRGWNNVRCAKCGHLPHGGSPCVCAEPDMRHDTTRWVAFQAWCEEWAVECLRVLKPGGHLLAFGGTRTWHRLGCAVEDAGFELRDNIAWLYGSGFPKSLDVSKAIDKAAGVEREDKFGGAIGRNIGPTGNKKCDVCGKWLVSGSPCQCPRPQDAPQSDDAKTWQGWGTALKPAFEPIIVARKPLIGTVAANVVTHGTGALNIDATRIATSDSLGGGAYAKNPTEREQMWGDDPGNSYRRGGAGDFEQPTGRWPANVILNHLEDCEQVGITSEFIGGGEKASGGFVDGYEGGDGFVGREVLAPVWQCAPGCQVAELDAQSGTLKSGKPGIMRKGRNDSAAYGAESRPAGTPMTGHGDSGGASRFFYCAKANKKERPVVDGVAHATVKPLTLMRWLVRLVTPLEGIVLEPFAGSGTTVEAAVLEDMNIIAIEREATYLPLIIARLSRPGQSDMFGGVA